MLRAPALEFAPAVLIRPAKALHHTVDRAFVMVISFMVRRSSFVALVVLR